MLLRKEIWFVAIIATIREAGLNGVVAVFHQDYGYRAFKNRPSLQPYTMYPWVCIGK